MYDLKAHCRRVKKPACRREKRRNTRPQSTTESASSSTRHEKMMEALENFTHNFQKQLKERNIKNEAEMGPNSIREMKIKEANNNLALQPFCKEKKANRKLKKKEKHVSFDLQPKIYFDYSHSSCNYENEYV